MAPRTAAALDRDTVFFLAIIAALTLIRFIGQHFSIVDLDIEEAQYWDWSQHLAFGYFSKPPLIAWVNALSGLVCGSSEECIRAPAPLFYFGTSLLVFLAAKELYGARAGLWAGLACALAPGVSFSARIMTTDVPLLFFWALALYAYVRLMRGGGWRWGVVLAAAFGLGLLAKYAMAYFVLGVLLAGLLSTDARRLLGRPVLWLALIGGFLMLTPNILWNASHGFATAGATADYVRKALSLDTPLAFLAAQFGVAGPVTFGDVARPVRLFRLAQPQSRRPRDACLRRPAARGHRAERRLFRRRQCELGGAGADFCLHRHRRRSRARQNAAHARASASGSAILAQAVLLVGDTVADKLTVPILGGNADIYQRVLGWDDLGEEIGALAKSHGAASVAVENRWEESALNYYLRGDLPVYIWSGSQRPTNHFETIYPLTAAAAEPILFVTDCAPDARLRQSFGSVTSLGTLEIGAGPTSSRTYNAFMLSGARDPLGGPPGCQ